MVNESPGSIWTQGWRCLRHLATGPVHQRLAFGPRVLDAIELAVEEAETQQASQICVVVELALPLQDLLRRTPARARAEDVFAQQRVWNTPQRDGVLIYILLADRDVEIVADVGLAGIAPTDWEACCRIMESHFRERQFEAGAVAGIRAVSALLVGHGPRSTADGRPPADFANRPTLI